MGRLAKEFDGEVVWLAVNSSWMNTPEQTRDWKQAQGFEYATLQDADGKLGRLYGATTTPDMFVIDGEGRIVHRHIGLEDFDPALVRDDLEKLARSLPPMDESG